MSSVSNRLADNLSRLRDSKGLTQQDVADALGLKKPGPVSEWENGTRRPGPKNLRRLAAVYGVQPSEIDPAGEAWNSERSRSERRGLQKSQALAEKEGVETTIAPPLAEAGAGMDIPDQGLFREVQGAWTMLRSKDDRRAFVEHVRRFMHEYTAPAPQHIRAKKVRR